MRWDTGEGGRGGERVRVQERVGEHGSILCHSVCIFLSCITQTTAAVH